MAVRETSLEAHDELFATGQGQTQAEEILAAMEFGRDYSLREIEAITGIDINAVSGRVNKLKALKLVTETEKRQCTITKKKIRPVQKIRVAAAETTTDAAVAAEAAS